MREPTVVAFWLPASDTLKQGEGADLLDDFRAYTGAVSPLLDQQGIKLETTTADSVVVELENGPRRVIRLSGLDYPFGYVLVEPGYPETILTGVSTDDELLEQVSWYFGLDEPDSSDAPGVRRTAGSAVSSRGGVTAPAPPEPVPPAIPAKTACAGTRCLAAGCRAAEWRRRCSRRHTES